jgi:hypothetical protein
MKWPLRNKQPKLPHVGAVGDFAFRRSFYYHPGVDLYCPDLEPVQTIEAGTIVHMEHFTGAGANPPSPWWLDTWSLMIEGQSGVIGYCEVEPFDHLKVGMEVFEGEPVAVVIPVLKKDKGNGRTMLHVEHYQHGTAHHVTWELDTPKPPELLNSRFLLEKLLDN